MTVRDAAEADLPGVLAIYNEVIATSTAVFSDQPATLDDRRAWFAQRRAAGLGKHIMLAGIDGENQASLAFHARFGFVDAGRLREVGHKFGRYIDLVFLQRAL